MTATRRPLPLLAACLLALPACAAEAPAREHQITAAVQAAPADRRDGAAVLGWNDAGEAVELRAGTNDLVCLADDPSDERFSVACYHRSLEPYMRRGRELRAAGVTDAPERLSRRWQEAERGELEMPTSPATLYVLTGSGYDLERDEVLDPYLRYVVYVPGATEDSTGLPLAPPAEGGPWLMYPGTPGAHIMINPPKEKPAGS